jgi:hypothetical protein
LPLSTIQLEKKISSKQRKSFRAISQALATLKI